MKLRLHRGRTDRARGPDGRFYRKVGSRWLLETDAPTDQVRHLSDPDRKRSVPDRTPDPILTPLHIAFDSVEETIRIPLPREPNPGVKRLLEYLSVEWFVDREAAIEMGWRPPARPRRPAHSEGDAAR